MRRETLPCAAAPCCAWGRVCLFGLPCCTVAALWIVAAVAAVEDAGGADAGIDPSVLVLHDAARFGSLEAVERVLARQPGAVDTPEPGAQLTPLMVAARAGHVRVVQRLIAGGADVNAMAAGHGTASTGAWWLLA